MPLTATSDTLEQQLAAIPQSALELVAPCHRAAGLTVYSLGEGRLRLACRACGQWLLDILGQRAAPSDADDQGGGA